MTIILELSHLNTYGTFNMYKPSISRLTISSFARSFIVLSVVILIVIGYGFRSFYQSQLESRALAVSEIVKAGLTSHMKAGIMPKREYFLQEIASTQDIQSLQIIRSDDVVKQYGKGNNFEKALSEGEIIPNSASYDWVDEGAAIMQASVPYIASSKGTLNCLSCHAVEEGTVLGAVEMRFDASKFQTIALSYIAGVTLIVMLFASVIFYRIYKIIQEQVAEPLDNLAFYAKECYEKGELACDLECKSKEFDVISTRFKRLNGEIIENKQLLEEQNAKLASLNAEIEETLHESILTMGQIEALRSGETKTHTTRVTQMSALLATYAGLDEKTVEDIRYASSLHDIGKLGIPDSILLKPGKLDGDEREVMNTHTNMGYEMLNSSDRYIFKVAQHIAHEHHEHFDGSGYPQGLKGDEISIYARIVAIIDVFDALINERVYKKAWSVEDVKEYLLAQSGKQFDPKLCELFVAHIDEFVAIKERYNKEH